MSDNPEWRAEWQALRACSCDFGISPHCEKCNESSAICECAYRSWVVNTKQRALNEERDLPILEPERDLAADLRAMYEKAHAETIKRGVVKLEETFTQHAWAARSKFNVNLTTDLGHLGDVTINEVLDAFFAKHPTLRARCTVTDNTLKVNLI